MTAESTTSPREDRIPWAAMAGTIATVTVFAVAQGLTYPLLSFILERQGTSPGLIGLSAAMTPLGFIVSAPFIPALVRRVGGARLAILCPGFTGRLPAAAIDLQLVAHLAARFRLGGVSFGIYTMSLIQLGERFTGQALSPVTRPSRSYGASAASWARPRPDWRCN